jgi:hypothetical protein
MRHRQTLTITSLLSILLFSLHWADEVARGIEPGTIARTWGGLLILAAGVPVLHMQGTGLIGGRIPANSSGALFWVWTNIALGTSGLVSTALAARTLRSSFSAPTGDEDPSSQA